MQTVSAYKVIYIYIAFKTLYIYIVDVLYYLVVNKEVGNTKYLKFVIIMIRLQPRHFY